MTREQIKAGALELDPVEREALAEELLLSIDGKDREAIDQAWLPEARRREADFRSGKTGARPVEEVLDHIERKGRA